MVKKSEIIQEDISDDSFDDDKPSNNFDLDRKVSHLSRFESLVRLLSPVRSYLIVCGLFSALGAAAGMLSYIAIAEIGRVVLLVPNLDEAKNTIWRWAAFGILTAALRLLFLFTILITLVEAMHFQCKTLVVLPPGLC